jgi:hypothetical protein
MKSEPARPDNHSMEAACHRSRVDYGTIQDGGKEKAVGVLKIFWPVVLA